MNQSEAAKPRNALIVSCGAHIIQDGLVALQYVLLPLLAQTLGLSYAQVGFLRALSNSSMSLLELPSGILAERFGEKRLLILGLVTAGIGYLGVSMSASFAWIAVFFLLTGAGAGFQHSLTSAILVKTFVSADKRRAMGTYNASGDAGKLAYTGLFGLAIGSGMAWNIVIMLLSLVAILFALAVWKLLPRDMPGEFNHADQSAGNTLYERWGIKKPRDFTLLTLVISLDSIVQSVFLTFLAFVLIDKGASTEVASFAVVLALSGGMTGKFFCGFLTARFGDYKPFIMIQLFTIAGLTGLIFAPTLTALIILPIIGLVVQGSSTVTYGVISDHVKTSHQARGFALIYSISGVATVLGPLLFGLIADISGLDMVLWILCGLTALSIMLASFLKNDVDMVESNPV